MKFDPEKGFFLNGKPVKVKGTCNHQDHAGVGAALPDAVQYYRVRKLQEMGCNAFRTSHNPPTPELLDACDELGMLVLDETRMMSSNPEGLSQFENLVRRDRNHPSVFMWSMGNEEGESITEKGLRILTSMKDVATKHDGSRPVSIAPPPGQIGGQAAWRSATSWATTTWTRGAEAYHKAQPEDPHHGHGKRQRRRHARHLRHGPRKGQGRLVRPVHHDRPRFGGRLVAVLQRAAMDRRRFRVDGLRLPRRTVALSVAQHQLAVRR